MSDTKWEQLEAFAREELGRPWFGRALKLTPDSRIEEDLRLTGLMLSSSLTNGPRNLASTPKAFRIAGISVRTIWT
jgi:hypothetical protein